MHVWRIKELNIENGFWVASISELYTAHVVNTHSVLIRLTVTTYSDNLLFLKALLKYAHSDNLQKVISYVVVLLHIYVCLVCCYSEVQELLPTHNKGSRGSYCKQ